VSRTPPRQGAFRTPAPTTVERSAAPPTFSVVIATYNSAATVGRAIESALAQTRPAFELIVVDDGSTDDTAQVVEGYGVQVTYLRAEHRGVAAARNHALGVARGEFFAVLDADDSYHPERIEALTELATARPDLALLCTDAELEVDGRVVGRFEQTCAFEVDAQRAAIFERCFCPWPAARLSALRGVGGFDESLRSGSDWECAIRLIHGGETAGLVAEPLYTYRVLSDSLTGDRVATLRDRVHFLGRFADDVGLSTIERAALERSLNAQRRALRVTETEAALRSRESGARRHALQLARDPAMSARLRAAGLAAAVAPRVAARVIERRSRAGVRSRLERSYPRTE
jgi:Glycosyl transferase family 2